VCILIISIAVAPLAACLSNKNLEDILPKNFGESEGLYLYSGNTKSRTDGSESQMILNSVQINGETYSDFTVTTCAYSTAANKIFFMLSVNGRDVLYLYDYKTGEGKDLYIADNFIFRKSEKYVYIKNEKTETGLLYSRFDGSLLCDEIYGELTDDLLCTQIQHYDEEAREWKDEFVWYNGGVKSVLGDLYSFSAERTSIHENYAYFLNGKYSSFSVNLDDGTMSELTFDDDTGINYCKTVKCSDGIYTLTVSYEKDKHLYTLIKLSGGKAETAYSFGNRPYGIEMEKVNDVIYFKIGTSRTVHVYRFDAERRKLSRISGYSFPKEKPERSQDY
ncbi:MAG: hypothetical protein K2L72_06125, partial [Clostridia bacterium]|nr:hypothetical protein [Clostridia bacterium]